VVALVVTDVVTVYKDAAMEAPTVATVAKEATTMAAKGTTTTMAMVAATTITMAADMVIATKAVSVLAANIASVCWYRFDEDFVPQERTITNANYNNNGNDGNNGPWYIDTGATDHITGELERLHTHDKYHGNDQVHTMSGAGYEY
jgi:hypothetical protein